MKERINSLRWFLLCGLYFFKQGTARRVYVRPKSLVIVQLGKLGDMVCTTPLFRAVREQSPQTKIIVVGDAVNAQILAGNKDVDRYVICGTDITAALRALREEHAEAAITVTPSIRALALLYLAGIPGIVVPWVTGGKSAESRLYKFLRPLVLSAEHRMGKYAGGEYLRMLEPFGIISQDTRKHLVFTPAAQAAIDSLLIPHTSHIQKPFLVGMSPAAGNKIKQWPAERFAALAAHIQKKYNATIVVIGGPKDALEVDVMMRALPPGVDVLNALGKVSLEELKALVARLDLFIGVDTGPIYVAEAFNVPTVDITGPVDEREQPPTGERHVVVPPLHRSRPELFVMNPSGYNYAEARRQVESITVDQVIAATEELIQRLNLVHI